jgi:acid phosphatase family membrane protein YuiD
MRSLLVAVAIQLGCQLFKVVYYSIREGRLEGWRLFSAGGMPSAHSALVTALAVSVGVRSGVASDLFAVAAVFGVIVIYDALRLRGAVGEHARVLNRLLALHPEAASLGPLREMVGHSPAEVAVGIAAGGGLAVAAWAVIG